MAQLYRKGRSWAAESPQCVYAFFFKAGYMTHGNHGIREAQEKLPVPSSEMDKALQCHDGITHCAASIPLASF